MVRKLKGETKNASWFDRQWGQRSISIARTSPEVTAIVGWLTGSGEGCVCVGRGGWRGGLAIKEGTNHCTLALTSLPILIWIAPLSFCSPLPLSVFLLHRGRQKLSPQSNQANSANKLSVGSSLSLLTHFTVSVAKQQLKCLTSHVNGVANPCQVAMRRLCLTGGERHKSTSEKRWRKR